MAVLRREDRDGPERRVWVNTLFFRYALEVERTRSITQAAENFFMAQPNLSRAIKEVEDTLGFTIFERTPKGVVPTKEGILFLDSAREIVRQLDRMKQIADGADGTVQRFSVSMPRGSYISAGVTAFIAGLDQSREIDMNIMETNSIQAVGCVADGSCNLGIIRYQTFNEPYFADYLKEKHMKSELIWEYECLALMSRTNPLARKETLTLEDLKDSVELSHRDMAVPYIDASRMRNEMTGITKKKIYIYERGNQFEILCGVPNTFIWVSPVPEELLKRHDLVQRRCAFPDNKFRDLLIYPEHYQFTDLDMRFVEKLYEAKTQVCYREYR